MISTAPIVDAGRSGPSLSDEEAFRLARSLDPTAMGDLALAPHVDFSVLGPIDKGITLWVRGTKVPYGSNACVAIQMTGDARAIAGDVSKTWRENGETITEAYTVELSGAASLLGPGRTTKHADGSESSSALGCLHVMGELSELRPDRAVYGGCPLRIASVDYAVTEEIVHDACTDGPHVCTRGRLKLGFTSMGSCGFGTSGYPRVKIPSHDCAACLPDPLAAAIDDLRRELVGREVMHARADPLTFFTTRRACEAR